MNNKNLQKQKQTYPYTYLNSNNSKEEGTSQNKHYYLLQNFEDKEEKERDQQEYITFLNQKVPYFNNSDAASIDFLNDDRLRQSDRSVKSGGRTDSGIISGAGRRSNTNRQFERNEPKEELFAEDIAQIRVTQKFNNNDQYHQMSSSYGDGRDLDERERRRQDLRQEEGQQSEVDYTSSDFNLARQAIEDAAIKQNLRGGPPERLRRVKRIGDTTVITEHRDPYSFYWQLDQLKNAEQEPIRIPPPVDYVLEEEEEEEEEQWIEEEQRPQGPPHFLSPDSGVHFVQRGENDEIEFEENERPVYTPIRSTEDPSAFSHYWHVDSGPRLEDELLERPQRPEEIISPKEHLIPSPQLISTKETAQQTQKEEINRQPLIEEHAFRQTTIKKRIDLSEEEDYKNNKEEINNFNVLYLGKLELKESDLNTIENSQTSLNNAIINLRNETGCKGILSVLSDGVVVKPLVAERKNGEKKEEINYLINILPISKIRCWAVGKDNPREFAFVSLDKSRLLCHVFRCDQSAKLIADTLGNICNSLINQKIQQRPNSFNGSTGLRRITRQSTPIIPSPIEEQKKIIRCHFIGVTQVPRATGIEMLNEAVDRLLSEVKKERWTLVDVHISPSSIIIYEAKFNKRQIASCRVRYLSFLGIGRDTKHCAFIVAQSSEHFICYVFHIEPSANSLAKTIEAACKLRYQKVLDAHLTSPNDFDPLSRSMPILDEWNNIKNKRGNNHF